jgi:predicted dehydrogenase
VTAQDVIRSSGKAIIVELRRRLEAGQYEQCPKRKVGNPGNGRSRCRFLCFRLLKQSAHVSVSVVPIFTGSYKERIDLEFTKNNHRVKMSSKQFNVGVIGYGLSAKVFHIPLILALPDDFKLYGVVQRSPKSDNDAQKDHPGIKSWRSVDEAYADPDVDLVVITSIPGTHFQMCKDALEAGKNVVVEKPFVPTAKEADQLIDIQKKSGKSLAVYQNRRWDADFVTLGKILDAGTLGDIAEFETHFDRHRPDPPADSWKATDEPGHGSIYDLGTHLIDQVYHLFGMPQRATGFVYQQRRGVKGGSHDSHTVLLHYGKMIATAKAGVVSPEVEQLRYWIKGTKGSFKKVCLRSITFTRDDPIAKERSSSTSMYRKTS